MNKDESIIRTNRSATIRQVAEQAQVSVATVSRYLNQNTPVSKELAERIEEAMERLSYIPDSTARKLATKRTQTIGLLMMELSNLFFAPLLKGIEEMTSQEGYDLLVSSSRKPQEEKRLFSPLGPQNVDGLIVFVNSLAPEVLARFYYLNFPLVLIHASPPQGLNIPCITIENKAATTNIVGHLIEKHHRRRIVFLKGIPHHEDSDWRERGYEEALKQHEIPYDPDLVAVGEFDRLTAENAIRQLIEARVHFDGVFSGDDEAAVGVIAALKAAGQRVPQDVSVVGFDDQLLASYLLPTLTTVRAPITEVGRTAAKLLIDRIHNREVPSRVLLPTEIVLRQSCGCN